MARVLVFLIVGVALLGWACVTAFHTPRAMAAEAESVTLLTQRGMPKLPPPGTSLIGPLAARRRGRFVGMGLAAFLVCLLGAAFTTFTSRHTQGVIASTAGSVFPLGSALGSAIAALLSWRERPRGAARTAGLTRRDAAAYLNPQQRLADGLSLLVLVAGSALAAFQVWANKDDSLAAWCVLGCAVVAWALWLSCWVLQQRLLAKPTSAFDAEDMGWGEVLRTLALAEAWTTRLCAASLGLGFAVMSGLVNGWHFQQGWIFAAACAIVLLAAGTLILGIFTSLTSGHYDWMRRHAGRDIFG